MRKIEFLPGMKFNFPHLAPSDQRMANTIFFIESSATSSVAEYFSKNRAPAKYKIGDRVTGKWNKIPFVGTVLVESLVSEEEGPKVMIFSDLPIKYKESWFNIVTLKPKDVKYFK